MAQHIAGTIASPNLDNVGDMKDIISNLHEDILLYILYLLPTKDAVRTSILSPKWRYLWTKLPVFNFENHQFSYGLDDQIPKSANCLFDLLRILLNKSNCVERLCVSTHRVTVDADKVNSFISSILKYNVQDLELSLVGIIGATVVLPHNFLASASLNKLRLDLDLTLYIHSGVCFPSLKTLVLCEVAFVNEKSVERLFSGCPVLQELSLLDCYWENIKQINVSISTLRMLTIHLGSGCPDGEENFIVIIDAVDLISLRCLSNPNVKFIIVNPIFIVDAHVDHYVYNDDPEDRFDCAYSAIGLLSVLSSVKSLKLTRDTLKCLSNAKETLHLLPSFHNLTHFHVLPGLFGFSETLDVLMDILHKTPKLEALTFPRGFEYVLDVEDWMEGSLPSCFKSSLKLFSISNFTGVEDEIQLVEFLLKYVTALEEIQIFYSRYLPVDFEKLYVVWKQLQSEGLGGCVIKLL